jgi:ABC-type maltose transport system permease subunit
LFRAVATAMSVLPIIVLYTVAQKSIIQGIMEGAVKG